MEGMWVGSSGLAMRGTYFDTFQRSAKMRGLWTAILKKRKKGKEEQMTAKQSFFT